MASKWLTFALTGSVAFVFSTAAEGASWSLDASDVLDAMGATPQNSVIIDTSTLDGNTMGPTVEIFVPEDDVIADKTTPAGTDTIGTQSNVEGEVGSLPNYLQFDFSGLVGLESLDLAWLFPDGEYGDIGNEVAVIETRDADGNLLEDFFLQAESADSATLYADSDLLTELSSLSVVNKELAQDADPGPAGGGVWSLEDAQFLGSFSTLRLFGGIDPDNPGANASDFSFASLVGVSAVPVPAALPLFITALIFLGIAGRMKRTN